jgi:dynein heavy chain
VLDPVLGKSTVKRGRAVIMKIGDAEVEVDPRFRLYLQVRATR